MSVKSFNGNNLGWKQRAAQWLLKHPRWLKTAEKVVRASDNIQETFSPETINGMPVPPRDLGLEIQQWLVMQSSGGVASGEVELEWQVEWGEERNPKDLSRAREFVAWAREEYPNLDSYRISRRANDELFDVAAIYHVDREVAIRMIAFANGDHDRLTDTLRDTTDPALWALIIRSLLQEEFSRGTGAEESAHYLEAADRFPYYLHDFESVRGRQFLLDYQLEAFFLNWAGRKDVLDQITSNETNLSHLTEGFIFVLALIEQAGAERCAEVWGSLSVEAREMLRLLDDFAVKPVEAAWQKTQAPLSNDLAWQESWGPAPSAEQIEAARAWATDIRGRFPDNSWRQNREVQRSLHKVDLRAAYLVDRELAVVLAGYENGGHSFLARSLRDRAHEGFWAEMVRPLLSGEFIDPENRESETDRFVGSAASLLTSWMLLNVYAYGRDIVARLSVFHRLGIARQILEFAGSSTVCAQQHNEQEKETLLILAGQILMWELREGTVASTWGDLPPDVRSNLLILEHTADVAPRVEAAWQSSQSDADSFSPTVKAFCADVADLAREPLRENGEVLYAPAVAQQFLETVPAEARAQVLERLTTSTDVVVQELAGLIVRSAVGCHAEVSRAVNGMNPQVAAELVARELALVPNELATTGNGFATRYKALDNFGALKSCYEIRQDENGASVRISPIWDTLSPEAKAEFFRVLWVYHTGLREMFTELLFPSLAMRVRRLPGDQYQTMFEALPTGGTRAFLFEKNILEPGGVCSEEESFALPQVEAKIIPNVSFDTDIEDLVVRAEAGFSVVTRGVEYQPGMQEYFTDNVPADQAGEVFAAFWQHDPRRAAALIRSKKPHEQARLMLSALSISHLTHVLDASVIGLPAFDKHHAITQFRQDDDGVVVRGLCLLETEQAVAALNNVHDVTLARIFDQAYVVAELLPLGENRSYLFTLLNQFFNNGVDKNKVRRALSLVQPQTAEWIARVYKGAIDLDVSRDRAADKYANDPIILAARAEDFNQNTVLNLVKMLEEDNTCLKLQGHQSDGKVFADLSDCLNSLRNNLQSGDMLQAVADIGRLWDGVRDNERYASFWQVETYLNSRELHILREVSERFAQFVEEEDLPLPFAMVQEKGLKSGQVTAQVKIVAEADYQRFIQVLGSLKGHHLVVAPNWPTQYPSLPSVPAMITSHGGSSHDHDTMKAIRTGALLVKFPGAVRLLRKYDGHFVTLSVSPESCNLKVASTASESTARAHYGLLEVPTTDQDNVCGVKADNLKDLIFEQLRVPETRFLDSNICYDLYRDLQLNVRIPAILGAHPLADRSDILIGKLARVKIIFREAQNLTSFRRVVDPLGKGIDSALVIFRPSTTFEDLVERETAGFFDSPIALNQPEAIATAILDGLASYWNLEPFMLRENNALDHFKYLPGGVLMALIEAQSSGSMIVRDGQIEIAAVPGQGQGAMTEQVPADHYVWSLTENKLLTSRQPRDSRTFYYGCRDGNLVRVALPADKQQKPALNNDQILSLVRIGKQFYLYGDGTNQQFEWVYDGKKLG